MGLPWVSLQLTGAAGLACVRRRAAGGFRAPCSGVRRRRHVAAPGRAAALRPSNPACTELAGAQRASSSAPAPMQGQVSHCVKIAFRARCSVF